MELTENKNLLQTVFNSAPNGIAVMQSIYNEKGRVEDFSILLFNDYTLRWIGAIDYKGKRYSDVFPMVKETGILEKFIEVAETGVAANFERWYTGEGMKHWFRFTAVKQAELLVVTTEDITERKHTEIALEQALDAAEKQKRLYDSITNNTPDLVYVFDLDYRFTYANKALLTMWGKTAEAAIGKGLRENGYEEWHALMHEREIDEVVATKKSIRGTVSFPHAELGSRIYDYILVPVFNEKGEVEVVAGTTRDVTEQVIAQKKLEESESRFRALVNASSDVVYRMNADWTVMRNLEGRGFLSDTGEPILNWVEKYIHPEDHKTVKKAIAAAIAKKSTFELEHRVLNADGALGWTFSRAIPILDDQDNIIEWFGAASDITSQKEVQEIIKENEEKFRQLADLVPQIIWTGQPDGFIDYYNKRWYEYTGFKEITFGDQSWIPMMHPDDANPVREFWYESVQKGTPYQIELRLQNGNTGEYRWFLSKALPIRDKAGVITKWFGTCTDIHEQKTITEKLEGLVAERTKELQRSNEDLQQFAHVASHDLKEPVRKIKTFTSRLEDQLDGKLDETGKRFMERIHAATDRMFTMIDGVLAYSTINADTQKIESVDLNEVIKNIETDLELALQKTGGTIQYNELPSLEGAPVLLYQLFYNLINNSLKFAKAGVAPQITIASAAAVEYHESFARITLQDNGISFEPDEAGRIFETFTRLNAKDKYEGTGLGLSLCKKIVERHGGNIIANGALDQGAKFTITLPLQQKETGI